MIRARMKPPLRIMKLIEAASYLLKKYDNRLNYTKLLKLLYLADRQSYRDIGSSITGDSYAALPYGPILSATYDLICNKKRDTYQKLWNAHFFVDDRSLVLKKENIGVSTLSDYEIQVLDTIDAQFHRFTFGQMIDYVHTHCPEWKDPKGSSKPILPEAILASVGKSQEEIDFLLEEEYIYAQEDKALARLACCNA